MFNFFNFFKPKAKLPPNAVIIDVRPTDFIAGGETGVSLKVLEPTGDYGVYLPDEESQYKESFDTFGCVSFSGLNSIETLFNYHLAKGGVISAANVQWLKDNGYFDKYTGKINFSDRFLAKVSGTTNAGNSVGKVGDAVRDFGLVPEALWPWPAQSNWADYYAEIPASVLALGLEFKKRFDITYQWVIASGQDNKQLLTQYLQYGPIQIIALVCSPWNANEAMPPIQGCGCGTQHATMVYGLTQAVSLKDFDHYRSFRKLLAWNYCIPYAAQYYVAERQVAPSPTKPTAPTVILTFGAPDSAPVRQLQACLQYLGYMKQGVFGPFGPATRTALAAFQVAQGIPDSPGGTNYGPKSRKALQTALG